MNIGVSIIIPTYNEDAFIGYCIESVIAELKQSTIKTEIIVVDNCSTDATPSIVKSYPVTYMTCATKGSPSATRNVGAAQAKYDILCFIDGDCLVVDGWLNRVVNAFSNEKTGAFGGPALSPATGNWIETAWAPIAIKPYLHNPSSLPGANFCIRKNLFQRLNGFDELLITAEDDDLSKRAANTGMDVIGDSKHPVIHLGYPRSLTHIYKKQLWHGSSQLRAHGVLGDKMVLMTFVWLISWALVIPALFISLEVYVTCVSVMLLCPAIVALKRIRNFDIPITSILPRAYLISFFFLAGRSVGLIRELLSRNKK